MSNKYPFVYLYPGQTVAETLDKMKTLKMPKGGNIWVKGQMFSNTLDVAKSPNKDAINQQLKYFGDGTWQLAEEETQPVIKMNVQEQVESWGQKNCAVFQVKPRSCSCCFDIEFNGHTHAYNVNEGLENLQFLLYDLVAGNIK